MYVEDGGAVSPRTLLRALSDTCERYATAYAGKEERLSAQVAFSKNWLWL